MRATMWSLQLLALFSLTASARPARRHAEPKPVCIIGAGPAGLSAAGRLEQKGIKAMVFDSQPEVGGKCQAWYDEK
jgi:NADPH-dependent glutamate synthase beta subunit-like oxidoreductase